MKPCSVCGRRVMEVDFGILIGRPRNEGPITCLPCLGYSQRAVR